MTKDELNDALSRYLPGADEETAAQRAALAQEFFAREENEGSLAIRALNLGGGLLGTITLVGFLALAGLFDSRLSVLVVGLLLFGGAFVLHRSRASLLAESFTVALSVVGSVLLLVAAGYDGASESFVCLTGTLLSVIVLLGINNRIVSFLAAFGLGMSLLALAILQDWRLLVHFFVALNGIGLVAWFRAEARLLTAAPGLCRRYASIRLALILSLLTGAFYLSKQFWWSDDAGEYHLAALVLIPLVVYLAHGWWRNFAIAPPGRWLYLLGLTLLLLPTYFAPAIAAALLVLLLAYSAGYRLGTVVGVAALVYFIGQYYYDLSLTLWTKSMVLMGSGLLLLLTYALFHQKLSEHEGTD